jgi:hypothetical protein
MANCKSCGTGNSLSDKATANITGLCGSCRTHKNYQGCNLCFTNSIPPGKTSEDCELCSNPKSYEHADYLVIYGPPKTVSHNATGPAINDYTCPFCKNHKCSKKEKSCWRCGGEFSHSLGARG